jgi:hypothetical protein
MEGRYFITPADLAARLRARSQQRGLVGLRGVGTLFRQAEEDGDQTFSLSQDIPKILSEFGVFMNKTEIVELVRHLDTYGTGEVTLVDFLAFLAPPLTASRESWVAKAFSKHDPGGTGALELSRIRRLAANRGSAVTRLAAARSSPEMLLQNFVRYHEEEGATSIPREAFFDYYRVAAAGFEEDREFISAVRSIWGV